MRRKFLLNYSLPFPENIQNQHLVVTYKMLLEAPWAFRISETPPRLYITSKEMHPMVDTDQPAGNSRRGHYRGDQSGCYLRFRQMLAS